MKALAAALVAVPLAVATRLPADGLMELLAGVVGGVAVAATALAAWRPAPWQAPVGLLALAILLAIPSPAAAWLDIHPALGALSLLLVAHLLYGAKNDEAPREGAAPAAMRGVLRWLPTVILMGLIAAAPHLATAWLPERLARSHELQGPAGIILAGFVALALLGGLALIQRLAEPSMEEPEPGKVEVPA